MRRLFFSAKTKRALSVLAKKVRVLHIRNIWKLDAAYVVAKNLHLHTFLCYTRLVMEEKIITIRSEEETRAFGSKLAEKAKPGMVIALIGDLGTGKTTLTKSIAAALGIRGHITSPTFNIVKEYKTGRLPLYHFDVYRITDPDEMYELGYEEYFYGDGVCVIEWADLIEELLPEHTIRIEIRYGEHEGERIYRCTC